MPVYPERRRSSRNRGASQADPSKLSGRPGRSVNIGLVNNMAESAFRATERQFVSLLNAASEDISVHLSLYTLSGVQQAEASGSHGPSRYASIESLRQTHLDGLIVTGREPMTPDLRQETYWESFTDLLEWAAENTYSTVWSCLAAHAAVLHMDGIGRSKSDAKHCGVFECAQVSRHALTAGIPASFPVPHSRWNGLAEEELAAHGYSVLTRTSVAGVDTFVKQQKSLFVFFQGHPEYESGTLLREYRRDVGRYLRDEATAYPSLPRAYFDRTTEAALAALKEKALSRRSDVLPAALSTALEKTKIENTWHATAVRLYRNWLEDICERKHAARA